MKLKILVKIVEKLLGMTDRGEELRADMFMPDRLLAMALVMLAGGTACAIYVVLRFSVLAVIFAAVGILFGVFALICWKNQTIRMISDEQFTYTTMFGNTKTYLFSEIQGLRKNQDSMTLLVAGQKVHIESMAVLSTRLVDRINEALEQANKKQA